MKHTSKVADHFAVLAIRLCAGLLCVSQSACYRTDYPDGSVTFSTSPGSVYPPYSSQDAVTVPVPNVLSAPYYGYGFYGYSGGEYFGPGGFYRPNYENHFLRERPAVQP
jgi:hypothetical protein